MGGASADDVEIKYFSPDLHGESVQQFKCRNLGEKHTRHAERAIRAGPTEFTPDGDACKIIVAVDTSRDVVGVILYGREEDKYVVHSLGVVNRRRREGIATALKKAAAADLADVSGGRIDLISLVHRRNTAMQGVNEKLGASSVIDPTDGEYLVTAYAVETVEDEDGSGDPGLTAFRREMRSRRPPPSTSAPGPSR